MKLPVSVYTTGTVVNIEFPFREGDGKSKLRPAVVLNFDESTTYIVLLQVTSHSPRTNFDYTVKDYSMAGLKQGSVVRCNNVYRINNSVLCDKRGNLSRQDLISVSVLYESALNSNNIVLY